jgi:hypothetical protein
MKYLKTNEEISNFLNKKLISNFDKLIERIDGHYNGLDWKCIRSNAHLFTGRSIKDTLKDTTLIISNENYKIIMTLTLLKEGSDKIQRLISDSRIQIRVDISHKKYKDPKSGVFSTVFDNFSTKFDKDSDIFNSVNNIIENNINLLNDRVKKDLNTSDFYDEYDKDTISDYLLDLRDLLNGEFKISEFKYGKGFNVSIITAKNLPYTEMHSSYFFEIDDMYVNTIIELNNLSKTLKNIGLNLKYSIDQLKNGTVHFIITESK